jgi:hypothetical protein
VAALHLMVLSIQAAVAVVAVTAQQQAVPVVLE